MVEFKLSSVINGDVKKEAKPVFPDSPAVGENYVPKKLKEAIRLIKRGAIDEPLMLEESDSEPEEQEENQYVVEEEGNQDKKKTVV